MRLALLTGAPGWLGTRLVTALLGGIADLPVASPLAEGGRVRCLVQPGADLAALPGEAEVVRGDLRDPASLRELCRAAEGAVVFHAAGVIHPVRTTREHHEVNVQGTRSLLAACEDAGVRRVVLLSSNSPFGFNANPDETFDEASPFRPYMSYGRSKQRLEELARFFHARGRLETVVVRAPWFYGPGQPPRQARFFTMIRRGRAPVVGDGTNRRSMAYVDNLCQGLLLCAEAGAAAGEAYWIADERPYTWNEIIDTVERLLETELGLPVAHRRLRLPAWTSRLAEGGDGLLQRLGRYDASLHVLSEVGRTIACSVAKAQRELGYAPHVALEEGMRRSLRWCLERGDPL